MQTTLTALVHEFLFTGVFRLTLLIALFCSHASKSVFAVNLHRHRFRRFRTLRLRRGSRHVLRQLTLIVIASSRGKRHRFDLLDTSAASIYFILLNQRTELLLTAGLVVPPLRRCQAVGRGDGPTRSPLHSFTVRPHPHRLLRQRSLRVVVEQLEVVVLVFVIISLHSLRVQGRRPPQLARRRTMSHVLLMIRIRRQQILVNVDCRSRVLRREVLHFEAIQDFSHLLRVRARRSPLEDFRVRHTPGFSARDLRALQVLLLE